MTGDAAGMLKGREERRKRRTSDAGTVCLPGCDKCLRSHNGEPTGNYFHEDPDASFSTSQYVMAAGCAIITVRIQFAIW